MDDSNNMPRRAFGDLRIEKDERPDNCEEHGDFLSNGHSIMGRPMHWSGCPVCFEKKKKEEEAAKILFEAEEAQRKMEARLNRAGIPMRFRGKNFDSYVADSDGKERAKATALEFASNFSKHYRSGSTIIFSGKPGTGKSHLAMAIAQAIMPTYTAFYTSAIDAVRMVRDTWRKGSERSEIDILNEFARVNLLILDEVGMQYGSDAEQITLFDIIDKRYRDMMPTILLTNQNKAGMKEFLGDRSFDRLRENGQWIAFDWDSHRGPPQPKREIPLGFG